MEKLQKLSEGTELQVGKHKVTIVKYISEGGFAHIYEVLINTGNKEPRIACLKRVIVADKNGLNLLRKEVDVMKTLRDARNIVTYIDSHAERLENGTYQVLVLMELCPGGSLLDYMNARIKTKLTEVEILKIMLDVSQGVYEMHRTKLIHRDIKIENVLINSQQSFKLCDFGSTTIPIMPPQDQQQFKLISHDILYHTTPQYRSPEMIDLYRNIPIDEKADIWALGCFLYKLCYYTTPFEANGDIAILHASFQFPQIPQYSGDLKNLIIIMLQENALFRPNIIQVLILICKIMNINFESLGIKDFYKLGPYNFQALQEYQAQKQNEIMQQKQIYYQQQSMIDTSELRSQVAPQVVPPPSTSSKQEAVVTEENLAPKSLAPPKESLEKTPNSLLGFSSENEEAISDLEQLEDAEERFPSLDDIDHLDKSLSSSSGKAPTRSTSMKTDVSKETTSKVLSNDYQNLDAWTNAQAQSLEKGAEQLADDIFANNNTNKQDYTNNINNASGQEYSNNTKNTPNNQFKNLSIDNASSSNNQHKNLNIDTLSSPNNPFPFARPSNLSSTKSESHFKPEQHKNHNPWGHTVNSPEEFRPSHKPTLSQSSNNIPKLQQQPDLIDLEVGLASSNSSSSILTTTKNNDSNLSLIDLNNSEEKQKKSSSIEKPTFKKRMSSTNNPSQIILQEEIIDFASDDENLDNGSDMSRIKIRNSLKKPKSRKSNELKRIDSSQQGDSKKRLSFFGGGSS
ncbi:AKL1 [Candida pseudojiufengensis]|uniref:AKL1 n=1 Tax=Candida pseudojiufengensis TaxID=497109 RepID=UPI002224C483|nr:AKL1 [Candida pseudojiufengensis]KAI5960085.1 AKL1 [Candida pseudojiufengensis]